MLSLHPQITAFINKHVLKHDQEKVFQLNKFFPRKYGRFPTRRDDFTDAIISSVYGDVPGGVLQDSEALTADFP
jgi:hypothetical protein